MLDWLIVGAGLSGATVAERLANNGYKVRIIDRRNHIAGNTFDYYDAHGVLVHKYGPHIFHTNSIEVFQYLSAFTDWIDYQHRVLAVVNNKKYPIPINRTTINSLYNLDLDEDGVRQYYDSVRQPIDPVENSEDLVVNAIGYDLFNKFYKGYTRKQWGIDARDLKAAVTARIPVRYDNNDLYFTDRYQGMPLLGYTKMIENMLDHPGIEVELGIDYIKEKDKQTAKQTIFTGPIDEYYGYCFGKLPYRSLNFEHIHYRDSDQFQEVGTVNYPNDHEYTRITEFKHLTGQICRGTSIVREYPRSIGDPYYPIPSKENDILYRRYKSLADKEDTILFTGRLARYKYYNMDQVVAASLTLAKKIINE